MALSLPQVAETALAIVDAYGLADLSMRRLGEALGVRASALYYHVPNKQTLLALVADRIVAEVPVVEGHGRSAVLAWAHAVRKVLLAHRDSADLVATSRAMGLASGDAASAPARLLVEEGLSEAQARVAASTLLHFVLGHVAEEQARLVWEQFGRPDADSPRTATAASFEAGVAIVVRGALPIT